MYIYIFCIVSFFFPAQLLFYLFIYLFLWSLFSFQLNSLRVFFALGDLLDEAVVTNVFPFSPALPLHLESSLPNSNTSFSEIGK